MTSLDTFITDARAVPLETVFDLAGGVLGRKQGAECVGPCPACGGRDRFSINFAKNLWFCRQYDGGRGGDGLALMAHKLDLDLERRADLLLACSEVQGGRPIPEGGERESEDARAAREARLAAREVERQRTAQAQDAEANGFRDKEIARARGIWLHAGNGAGTAVEAYLRLRSGAATLPSGLWESLRFSPTLTYWHGRDDRGHPLDLHSGPALIAPLVDLSGKVTGCHQTWIDLDHPPKLRPLVLGPADADGRREPLPTKKMRGHKKGSLIPILGDHSAPRWMVGEGIETVLAVAAWDGFREDTFYAAAGDIGNLAGPAEPKSAFNHPTLTREDAKGRARPVKVAGPVPKPGSEADCFQILPHVGALVLLADGDSEHWFTCAAMARAEARLKREGLAIETWWPLEGGDFADMARMISGEAA